MSTRKAYDHAVKHAGHHLGYRASQHAVVDLRPLRAVLDPPAGPDDTEETSDGR